MTVVGIAWKSLRHRLLATVLTVVGIALATALVAFVFRVRDASKRAFDDAAVGYDVVIGGIQTSALTSVLSTVFHVDQPIDTVPIEALTDLRADKRVKYAVPYAVGDTYRGFRVVGTTPELFDAITDAERTPLRQRIGKGGRVLGGGAEFEAVVGALAAARTGLRLGATFTVSHGLEEGGHHHDELWTVVGLLEPTGTPNDRAISSRSSRSSREAEGPSVAAAGAGGRTGAAAMDGARPDHDPMRHGRRHGRGHGPGTNPGMDAGMGGAAGAGDADHYADHDADHDDEAKAWAVSSIVVRLTSPAFRYQFVADMNARRDLKAALPSTEIARLFRTVDMVDLLLRAIAALVVLVSALGILVGLYNTMEGRRREIAILRSLGARPAHVFSVVILEAVLMCVLGGIVGVALGHAGVAVASPLLLEKIGVRVGPAVGGFDALLVAGLAVIGVLAGLVPAWSALRTPVAKNLHPID
jgi:putative ABC transport system permease protein